MQMYKIKTGLIFMVFIGMSLSVPIAILVPAAFAGDVIIIANKSVHESSLSSKEIKNIFLGRKTQWSNNKKIIFVTLKGVEVHGIFLKEYTGKTPFQYINYWRKQVFTGKGRPPKSFKTESSLVDYVANTEGAIGYVSPGLNKDIVKTVRIKN